MMARVTQVYSIDEVARRIGESLDLIEIVSWNDDNIDYGEMIRVYNGTDESLVTFTERGMGSITMSRTVTCRAHSPGSPLRSASRTASKACPRRSVSSPQTMS